MNSNNEWRAAGFASERDYRNAQSGLEIVAIFGIGVIVASVICLVSWFFGIM